VVVGAPMANTVITFTDVFGTSISKSAITMPNWMTYDDVTAGSFDGTPGPLDVGVTTVKISVKDNYGLVSVED
jgi:hypothetical protein